ncbi:MAG: 50S ribosomal protein L21 [Actinomycetales bacterium]|nr:50S ribosomal protein L21 [Actinomycetales bacterium]
MKVRRRKLDSRCAVRSVSVCVNPHTQEQHEVRNPVVYAIVRNGRAQTKVVVGDVISIDQVQVAPGESLQLPAVMLVDGEAVTAGADVASVKVDAEVIGGVKGPKISIQKYKNKTGYKKRMGHRQKYTQVKITGISK